LEKNKATNKTLFSHFPASELWIHCAWLTWQEKENLGPEAHFGALPGALPFCVCISWYLDRNYCLFTVLTG